MDGSFQYMSSHCNTRVFVAILPNKPGLETDAGSFHVLTDSQACCRTEMLNERSRAVNLVFMYLRRAYDPDSPYLQNADRLKPVQSYENYCNPVETR